MEDKTADKGKIAPQQNGPLDVQGVKRLVNSHGDEVRVQERFALCRCGKSKTKPFCDGTHTSIGFSDAKRQDRVKDQLDSYPGRDVEILDNRGVCSHAGFCTSGLPSVWRGGVEPWIDPDGADAASIVDTIEKCPSGALSYKLNGELHNHFHNTPEIVISRDGPYCVHGSIELVDTEFGQGASREHYALCRCGHSKNKPFCDGSHWYAAFRDDEGLTISRARRDAAEAEREQWTTVGKLADFAEDEIHSVEAGGRELILVRSGETVHVLSAKCPHQGGPLAEGQLCDDAVRCPWHGYDFALSTGHGKGNDLQADAFETRVEDGLVQVRTPDSGHPAWTISHVIAETMSLWGIDTVFGMVGHSNLGMAEALRTLEAGGRLRYFGIRHEGAAAFAASGYAKAGGKPAACLSIAGPGATNLLTGLWDAKVDRAPVLALTGQVQTQVMGPGAFQEIDLASAFSAVSAFSQTVLPGSDPAELTGLALKHAIIERDVAHLILPDEVQTIDAGETAPARPEGRISQTAIAPPRQSVEYALYRINASRRPVIVVGYGAREGMQDVIRLAEKLHCPVITTFKAKGQIGDDHALGAGVLGRSGTPVASWFMNEADLLIVFGASFSNHTGIVPDKPIVQVDFDRMALGKFHPVSEPVWGDVAVTARLFGEALGDTAGKVDQRDELATHKSNWDNEKREREKQDRGMGVNSAVIFRHLSNHLPEDAIVAVDVGNNTYSFGRYFETKRHRVLMSGYLGSIGFAFPAAMGAWATNSGRPVISISGDGGLGQYMTEFQTAVKYGMKITHVLLNNGELGKISKEQRDGDWEVWQTSLVNVGFAEFARLSGGMGIRVESAHEIPDAIDRLLSNDGPGLLEIMSDPMLT